MTDSPGHGRPYRSELRQEQAARTRLRVVQAAVRLFDGHPHMSIFVCDGVEVMPVLGD